MSPCLRQGLWAEWAENKLAGGPRGTSWGTGRGISQDAEGQDGDKMRSMWDSRVWPEPLTEGGGGRFVGLNYSGVPGCGFSLRLRAKFGLETKGESPG